MPLVIYNTKVERCLCVCPSVSLKLKISVTTELIQPNLSGNIPTGPVMVLSCFLKGKKTPPTLPPHPLKKGSKLTHIIKY